MIIFHGSQHIVEIPLKSAGKVYNDYGQGFYCTENLELAKEWACPVKKNGYANQYHLQIDELNVLHLTKGSFNILNWLAVLLRNREFDINSSLGKQAKEYIIENFMPNLENVDVMIGYRADDSYFSFAEDFVNNLISLRDLGAAMQLGTLGEQVVLLSEKSFRQIAFQRYEIADYREYYFRRKERDQKARKTYKERKADLETLKTDIFILDIIREEMKNDDPRLRFHISG